MNRRTLLATSAGIAIAGCLSSRQRPSDSSGDDDTDDAGTDPTNGTGDDTGDGTGSESGGEYGTIDDFESLDEWSIRGGSLSPDEERVYVGSQSARVEAPLEEESTVIERHFDEPLDVTNAAPGVAVTADDIVVPWVRLIDADGNRVDYRRGIKGGQPFMRYNVGIDNVHGSFDPTNVTLVQLQLWTGDQERTAWFDDLFLVPRPETGKVMIQFDDAHETDYTEALPLLEAHDIPAVTFVNPNYIDRGEVAGDSRLSVEQTHELHEAGWTIANHTYSHPRLPELDPEEQEAEIRDGKQWLLDHGFETGARYFAYPFGEHDETTLELVDEYHEIGWAGGRPAQGYVANPLLASRIGEPSADRAKEALQWTAEFNGITGLFYHRLEGEMLADFAEMVEMVAALAEAGHIEVILPQDVEDQYVF